MKNKKLLKYLLASTSALAVATAPAAAVANNYSAEKVVGENKADINLQLGNGAATGTFDVGENEAVSINGGVITLEDKQNQELETDTISKFVSTRDITVTGKGVVSFTNISTESGNGGPFVITNVADGQPAYGATLNYTNNLNPNAPAKGQALNIFNIDLASTMYGSDINIGGSYNITADQGAAAITGSLDPANDRPITALINLTGQSWDGQYIGKLDDRGIPTGGGDPVVLTADNITTGPQTILAGKAVFAATTFTANGTVILPVAGESGICFGKDGNPVAGSTGNFNNTTFDLSAPEGRITIGSETVNITVSNLRFAFDANTRTVTTLLKDKFAVNTDALIANYNGTFGTTVTGLGENEFAQLIDNVRPVVLDPQDNTVVNLQDGEEVPEDKIGVIDISGAAQLEANHPLLTQADQTKIGFENVINRVTESVSYVLHYANNAQGESLYIRPKDNADVPTIVNQAIDAGDSPLLKGDKVLRDYANNVVFARQDDGTFTTLRSKIFEIMNTGSGDPEAQAAATKRALKALGRTLNTLEAKTDVVGAQLASEIAGAVSNVVSVRMSSAAPGAGDDVSTYGTWVEPFYQRARQKADTSVSSDAGYKARTYGATVGFDADVTDNMVLGLAAHYSKTEVDFKDVKDGDKLKSNNYFLYLYGSHDFGNDFFAQSTVSYARINSNSSEILDEENPDNTTRYTKHKMDVYGASLTGGYNFRPMEDLVLSPIAGVAYTKFNRGNSTSSVVEGFENESSNQTRKNYYKLELIAGLTAQWNIAMEDNMMITPQLRMKVRHNTNKDEMEVVQANPDLGADLGRSSKLARTMFDVGAGVTFTQGAMEYGINYDGSFGSRYQSHKGSLKVRVNF